MTLIEKKVERYFTCILYLGNEEDGKFLFRTHHLIFKMRKTDLKIIPSVIKTQNILKHYIFPKNMSEWS